jgi:sialate O-acetylesterase
MLRILMLAIYLPVYAQERPVLQFADVLTDNMVIQQNKPFTVWGTAGKYEPVKIEADWLKTSVVVQADDRGNFTGIIPVPTVHAGDFSEHTLQISSGTTARVVLSHILIGEVWFCGGQSNMQSPVGDILNGKAEAASADFKNIRLFNAALNFSNSPLDNVKGQWVVCTPQSVEKFSAVAYFFARQLHTILNVPVGVIFSGIGASAAQAYVPREVLAADPLLDSAYLQPYLASEKSREVIDGGFSFEKVTRPFLLYNAMIHPFRHLSIRGFCWYQGESNRNERSGYTHLMHTLIQRWRSNFAQGELPFYFVQVAPFFWDQENPELADYAFFREAQGNILTLDNTGMVLTMDVGEAKDLHPKNKKPVGIRLGLTALHRTYGRLSVVYQGPQLKTVSFEKGSAIVTYLPESIAGGLRTNDGGAPKFFTLAGEDGKFYPAEATIVGNQVKVTTAKVKRPVALRYAFTNYAVTNLENGNGLPAVPFRTDSWREQKNK